MAVFGFMVMRSGRTVVRNPIFQSQPSNTRLPRSTNRPAPKSGDGPVQFVWVLAHRMELQSVARKSQLNEIQADARAAHRNAGDWVRTLPVHSVYN